MINYFTIVASSFLFVLGAILPIVNPPAIAPIYWTLTSGATNQVRKILAKKIAINVFIMVLVAIFLGNYVLSLFGISLAVVRVGGGLIVVVAAGKLLNAEDPDTNIHKINTETFTLEKARRSAFYPLTFPISCGPGTIAASITVGASLQQNTQLNLTTSLSLFGTVLGVFAVALAVYFSLRFAVQFLHKLGQSGTVIFMRMSAFILLCIGVQIMWTGIHDLVLSLYSEALKLQ